MTSVVTPEVKVESEADRLAKQKTRFISIIEETFEPNKNRCTKLLEMYNIYGDRLIEAPASSKIHYHNAYAGGYIDHVLHVYDTALQMVKVLRHAGGSIDFNKQELAMAALHHDLWKLGMPGGQPYYEVESSDWHRKNQGSMFKHNEKLPFFKVTDGALYILQKYNIDLTYNEWMGIKLSDGLYEDSNKGYLMNHGKFPVHTNLGYVIHWADHSSTNAERDPLKQEFLDSFTDE